MRKHQSEATLWDDERAQLTDLIEDTMQRQKEFNEQLLSQRGAWDEMAAIKSELEIENERLRKKANDLHMQIHRISPGEVMQQVKHASTYEVIIATTVSFLSSAPPGLNPLSMTVATKTNLLSHVAAR